MRLFTLCTYLKTKESYDRWVTRRLWEFRQQISKAKYLKMSVGNIKKLQENTAALYTERKTLRVSAIRGSKYVWPEKLKRPPLPSGCEISGCEMSVDGIPMWNIPRRQAIRINSIRIPSRGHAPSCYPDSLWEKHTTLVNITLRTIAYPIRICCPDGKHWLI